MIGTLSVVVRAEIAGHEVKITATSSGGRRQITIAPIETFTLEAAINTIRSHLSSDVPDLPSGPWRGLKSEPLGITAWIGSEDGKSNATLDFTYDKAVSIPPETSDPLYIGGSVTDRTIDDAIRALVGHQPLATVEGLTISYDETAGLRVKARIVTKTFKKTDQGSSTATAEGGEKRQIVGLPLPVPATAAPPLFHLNYLGIGQRVGPEVVAPGSSTSAVALADPLATIFGTLESDLSTNEPKDVLTRLAKHFYKPDRDWFIAADVAIRGFRLRALFNDPAMYGLEITVAADPPNFFSGLLFEILYQKLGPGRGVYFGALTLPDAMRRIDIDGAILVLPGFSVWIYTDGDFRLNVGWPLGDSSIGVIVGPLTGHAGFYVAKLRSCDDPGADATDPTYDPILQFGIAWEVNAEVDCSAGPLSASLSLSFSAILQGVIAWKAEGGSSVTGPPEHYWFAGSASEVLVIRGSIDFAIIKASLTVRLAAAIRVAYETKYATVVEVSAEVSVDLAVHVVFFTVHLSFDMTVSHTFTFGSGLPALVERPREPGLVFTTTPVPSVTGSGAVAPAQVLKVTDTTTNGRTASESSGARLTPKPPSDGAAGAVNPARGYGFHLLLGATPLPKVAAQFALLPTAVFAEADKPGRYALVAALILDAPLPRSPASDGLTAFETMATAMFGWMMRKVRTSGQSDVDALTAAASALGHGSDAPSDPFVNRDGFLRILAEDLATILALEITGVNERPSSGDRPPPGALFPLPEALMLDLPGPRSLPLSLPSVSPTDADALNQLYSMLGLGEAGSENRTKPGQPHSLAHLIFGDYVLLLLRQMVSSIDVHAAARDLSGAVAALDFAGLAGFASRVLVSGLRMPAPTGGTAPHTLDEELHPLYALTGQQFEAGDDPVVTARVNPGKDASWITLSGADEASIVLPIDASNHTRSVEFPGFSWKSGPSRPAPGSGEIVVRQASAVVQAPLDVMFTRQTAIVGAGGTSQALLALPAGVLPAARGGQEVTLTLAEACAKDLDGATMSGALLIPISIGRIPRSASTAATASASGSSAGAASPWLSGLYVLTAGCDEATRERLHGLLMDDGLMSASATGAGSTGPLLTIALLTTAKEGGGFTCIGTASGSAPGLSLVRTQPAVDLGRRDPSSHQPRDLQPPGSSATVAEQGDTPADPTLDWRDSADAATAPGAFLRLLWEACADPAAGMVLCGPTALGLAEKDVFGGGISATVDILVTPAAAGTSTIAPVAMKAGSPAVPIVIPAWADRILVSRTPTIGVAARVSTATGPLLVAMPAMPVGVIGFEIDVAQPPPPTDGAPDVAALYHLIQCAAGPQREGAEPRWGLPVGPEKIDSSMSDRWPFHQTLSLTAQAGPTATPLGPYDKIGQAVPTAFRLVDIFGNALPKSFSPSPAFLRRYADPLIAPGRWPGVKLSCLFGPGEAGTATLTLEASLESGGSGQTESLPESAVSRRCEAILAQLDDGNTTASLSTDLDGGKASETSPALKATLRALAAQIPLWTSQTTRFAVAPASAELDDAARAALGKLPWPDIAAAEGLRLVVTGYGDDGDDKAGLALKRATALKAWIVRQNVAEARVRVATETGPTAFQATIGLLASASRKVRLTDVHDAAMSTASGPRDLVALSVALVLSRLDDRLVDGAAARLLPEVRSASSPVFPHHDPVSADPAPTGTDVPLGAPETRSLAAFAASFEAAFAKLDDGTPPTRLKLAHRSGVAESAADDTPSLWVVRMGPKGFKFTPLGIVTTHALRPLATQALSGTLADGSMHNDVDLDAAATACLRAIDEALTPARAAALVRLAPTLHGRLLNAKRLLAEAIPMGLATVLPASGSAGDPDAARDLDAARDALERALLISLGSAASVTAAVQMKVEVVTNGTAGIDRDKAPPLVFIGDVGADLKGASAHVGHVSFSSASLPASGAGPHVLTSLLSAADPGDAGGLLVDLIWSPDLLQHDFELDETYSGYTPSSFLKFARPDTDAALPFASAKIPLPLWLDPVKPHLGTHAAIGPADRDGAPDVTVADAAALGTAIDRMLSWSYAVTVTVMLSEQDELWFSPGFNSGPKAAAAADGVPQSLRSLFEAVVGMQSALPRFAGAFSSLDAFAATWTKPDDSPASPAPSKADLAEFIEHAMALALHWPRDAAAGASPTPSPFLTADWLSMGHAGGSSLSRSPADTGAVSPLPEVVTVAQPAPAGPASGPAPTMLRLTWRSLSLRQHMTADFGCFVRRNSRFDGVAADAAFVLHTPVVTFPTSVVPLIVSRSRLVVMPSQPLAAILATLMGKLAEVGEETTGDAALSFDCRYVYQLMPHLFPGPGAAGLMAEMPVLIGTDVPLSKAGVADEANGMARAVIGWMARVDPTRRGASLDFGLTLYGTPDMAAGERLALVQLERISIPLEGAGAGFWDLAAETAGAGDVEAR